MEDKKSVVLTSKGKEKLEAELNDLKVNQRADIAEKIKEARAQGDLSENAEYDAAKEEQGHIESRITEIEAILKHAVVIDAEDTEAVKVGHTVTVYDEEFDEEIDLAIVGSTESNSLMNKISNDSPVGMALLGSKVGDVVEVEAPAGLIRYEIRAIRQTDEN